MTHNNLVISKIILNASKLLINKAYLCTLKASNNMGLKIHTLAEIPDSVSKNYYLYILDYYNWDEPIGNTLRENFDKIAEFAANNNSVVIQGMAGSHFYSELMSWESINGIDPLDLLPALMITTLHPKYFIDGNNKQLKGKNIPTDKFVFLEIRKICQRPEDVVVLLEKIFQDIKEKKAIQDFKVKKELKEKTLKELDYIIPASARIVDSKHDYKVNKNMLEYTITVQTSENIANVYSLSKAEAENMIREQNTHKEGEEVVPSNPEKRPINDIRNEFENTNNKEDDNKDQNTN